MDFSTIFKVCVLESKANLAESSRQAISSRVKSESFANEANADADSGSCAKGQT